MKYMNIDFGKRVHYKTLCSRCVLCCRLLWKWTEARERPPSGALVQLQTRGGDTELVLTPAN